MKTIDPLGFEENLQRILEFYVCKPDREPMEAAIRTMLERERLKTPIYSGINDVNGKPINDGSTLIMRIIDGEVNREIFLPVFFENGAFWIDKSDKFDRSEGKLLCEFPNPETV